MQHNVFIPYYNNDDGKRKFIFFTWHPSVETFREFKALHPINYDSWVSDNLAHDVMGNDQFRLKKTDEV